MTRKSPIKEETEPTLKPRACAKCGCWPAQPKLIEQHSYHNNALRWREQEKWVCREGKGCPPGKFDHAREEPPFLYASSTTMEVEMVIVHYHNRPEHLHMECPCGHWWAVPCLDAEKD